MKQPQDRHDETIDKVFAGLRDAQAPAGMEDRILRAMEARAAAQPRSVWRIALPAWISNPASTACVAGSIALASVLAVVFFIHSTRGFEGTPTLPRHTAATTASNSPGSYRTSKPWLSSSLSEKKLHHPERTLTRSLQPTQAPLSAEDALALSEMLAPSKPAPPLPLTHQEDLLAQVVRKGDPEQIAYLKSELRARQMEIAKAEFHDFFEPPPVKQSE